VTVSEKYRHVGEAARAWVLDQIRDDDGPWLPDVVRDDQPTDGPAGDRDSLYSGVAGLAPLLAEIARARPLNDAERALSAGISTHLATMAATRVEPSLYDGLAGDAVALRLLEPGAEHVAIDRLADLMTMDGWNTTFDVQPGSTAPITDVVMGTAGIVMAALWVGGATSRAIAESGGEALLRVAEQTAAGLDWRLAPGWRSSSPNYSHGTAGVVAALAIAGNALGRVDFLDAACAGAQHLVAVASLDDGGLIIPHTIPDSTRDVERVTYTWCHGPTGTSQAFAALLHAGVDEVAGYEVAELRQRCLHSVLTSGVPQRLRPGFWDNDGRCCGTAGVGDVLLDAAQDSVEAGRAGELLSAAYRMADALVERAIHDDSGARWRFIEHRQDPPLLPPGTSWMQGAAGIAAFLLRIARVADDGLTAPVVDRPDQWWAVPAELRTVCRETPTRRSVNRRSRDGVSWAGGDVSGD
jgi:lantibiotic modifying enzyme